MMCCVRVPCARLSTGNQSYECSPRSLVMTLLDMVCEWLVGPADTPLDLIEEHVAYVDAQLALFVAVRGLARLFISPPSLESQFVN